MYAFMYVFYMNHKLVLSVYEVQRVVQLLLSSTHSSPSWMWIYVVGDVYFSISFPHLFFMISCVCCSSTLEPGGFM
jgi:hypothetical protein